MSTHNICLGEEIKKKNRSGNVLKFCTHMMLTKWHMHSADPDQTVPEEQSDQGLHCLPFHYFKKLHKKQNLGQNSME